MLPPMGDTVRYDVEGAVATLTLNRPDRLNAIVPELIDDLRGRAGPRPGRRGGARRSACGAPGAAFCAGYDIDWGAEMMAAAEGDEPWDPIADYQTMSRYVVAYMRLWRSPKPVIAQVHGFCVGGGTDFALCSDLIVCAEDCRIGYPPARVWGSPTTSMWVYRLGLERAKRLLLTGRPARRAHGGRVGPGLARRCRPTSSTTRRSPWRGAWRSCPPTSST